MTRRRVVFGGVVGAIVLGVIVASLLRDSSKPDTQQEMEAIVDAIGLESSVQVGYGSVLPSEGGDFEERCEGFDDKSARFQMGRVTGTSIPPRVIVDRIVAHYRGTTGEVRLYESSSGGTNVYLVKMLDRERHRFAEVLVGRRGTLNFQAAGDGCDMEVYNFEENPEGQWREIPVGG